MLYRIFYLDLWCPLWPNLAASAVCSTIVYLRLRVHQKRQHAVQLRQHAELKQHITNTLGANSGNVS